MPNRQQIGIKMIFLLVKAVKGVFACALSLLVRSMWEYKLYRERKAAIDVLRHIDDRGLKDIGLYRSGLDAAVHNSLRSNPKV
jgi:uncharacterized protein YjiS (DUF1127 family)